MGDAILDIIKLPANNLCGEGKNNLPSFPLVFR